MLQQPAVLEIARCGGMRDNHCLCYITIIMSAVSCKNIVADLCSLQLGQSYKCWQLKRPILHEAICHFTGVVAASGAINLACSYNMHPFGDRYCCSHHGEQFKHKLSIPPRTLPACPSLLPPFPLEPLPPPEPLALPDFPVKSLILSAAMGPDEMHTVDRWPSRGGRCCAPLASFRSGTTHSAPFPQSHVIPPQTSSGMWNSPDWKKKKLNKEHSQKERERWGGGRNNSAQRAASFVEWLKGNFFYHGGQGEASRRRRMRKGGACPVSCLKKDVRDKPNSALVHLVLFSVQVRLLPCSCCPSATQNRKTAAPPLAA